jgi:hypothetical protein
MGVNFEDAVQIVNARRAQQGPLLAQMIAVRDRYNGDYAYPLAPNETGDQQAKLIPALLAEGVDMPAMKASSSSPTFFFPAVDPTRESGAKSTDWAGRRRRAASAVWSDSKWLLLRRRLYRHIAGYARGCLLLVPDHDRQMPQIVLRDPLSAYPEPKAPEDVSAPRNAGFVFARTAGMLARTYGEEVIFDGGGPISTDPEGWESDLWDCLEWIDDERCLLGIMGPSMLSATSNQHVTRPHLLRAYPNPVGYCPGVVPQSITLDKIVSRLVYMTAKVDTMSYLMELDIAATERAVFPDRWVIARPNETPRVVGGAWKDGRSGEVNLLTGVADIGELRGSPDPNNKLTIRELERQAKMDAGTTAVQGGEGMGAFRTGRAIDSLVAASFDPRVQELQDIAQTAMGVMNEAILDAFVAYWPEQKYVIFSGWPGDIGHVEFRPRTHFKESTANVVTYAMPGLDSGTITVQLGQLVQADLIARDTARRLHPHINSSADEEQKIYVEKLREGLIGGILMRLQGGQLSPADASIVIQQLQEHPGAPEAAILAANEQIQRRQAALAAVEPPPGLPAAQPGMALPGEPGAMPSTGAPPGVPGGGPPPPGGPPGAGPPALNPAALVQALQASPAA